MGGAVSLNADQNGLSIPLVPTSGATPSTLASAQAAPQVQNNLLFRMEPLRASAVQAGIQLGLEPLRGELRQLCSRVAKSSESLVDRMESVECSLQRRVSMLEARLEKIAGGAGGDGATSPAPHSGTEDTSYPEWSPKSSCSARFPEDRANPGGASVTSGDPDSGAGVQSELAGGGHNARGAKPFVPVHQVITTAVAQTGPICGAVTDVRTDAPFGNNRITGRRANGDRSEPTFQYDQDREEPEPGLLSSQGRLPGDLEASDPPQSQSNGAWGRASGDLEASDPPQSQSNGGWARSQGLTRAAVIKQLAAALKAETKSHQAPLEGVVLTEHLVPRGRARRDNLRTVGAAV